MSDSNSDPKSDSNKPSYPLTTSNPSPFSAFKPASKADLTLSTLNKLLHLRLSGRASSPTTLDDVRRTISSLIDANEQLAGEILSSQRQNAELLGLYDGEIGRVDAPEEQLDDARRDASEGAESGERSRADAEDRGATGSAAEIADDAGDEDSVVGDSEAGSSPSSGIRRVGKGAPSEAPDDAPMAEKSFARTPGATPGWSWANVVREKGRGNGKQKEETEAPVFYQKTAAGTKVFKLSNEAPRNTATPTITVNGSSDADSASEDSVSSSCISPRTCKRRSRGCKGSDAAFQVMKHPKLDFIHPCESVSNFDFDFGSGSDSGSSPTSSGSETPKAKQKQYDSPLTSEDSPLRSSVSSVTETTSDEASTPTIHTSPLDPVGKWFKDTWGTDSSKLLQPTALVEAIAPKPYPGVRGPSNSSSGSDVWSSSSSDVTCYRRRPKRNAAADSAGLDGASAVKNISNASDGSSAPHNPFSVAPNTLFSPATPCPIHADLAVQRLRTSLTREQARADDLTMLLASSRAEVADVRTELRFEREERDDSERELQEEMERLRAQVRGLLGDEKRQKDLQQAELENARKELEGAQWGVVQYHEKCERQRRQLADVQAAHAGLKREFAKVKAELRGMGLGWRARVDREKVEEVETSANGSQHPAQPAAYGGPFGNAFKPIMAGGQGEFAKESHWDQRLRQAFARAQGSYASTTVPRTLIPPQSSSMAACRDVSSD